MAHFAKLGANGKLFSIILNNGDMLMPMVLKMNQ